MKYKGVNQAGAEFLKGAWPGQRGDQGDFQWPKNNSISVFVAKGMNIFRIPISWVCYVYLFIFYVHYFLTVGL